jgi:hypothetical protein
VESNKVKKVIFLVFLVIAIGVWGYNLTLFFPKTDQFKVVRTDREKGSKLSPQATSQTNLSQQDFVYESSFKDPFTPFFLLEKPKPKVDAKKAPPKPEPPPPFAISGIVWDKKSPYAVISGPNGETYVVRKGDMVGEIKISQIEPKQVWFLFKGRKYKLELPG